MICLGCNQERKEADFFGKEKCYKCIYKEKLQYKFKKEKARCKVCDAVIEGYRRKFCSQECVDKNMKTHNKNYWIRNISSEPIRWD